MAVNNTRNFQMYCVSMEPSHYSFIKNLGYVPVGLGKKNLWRTILSVKKSQLIKGFTIIITTG